MTLSNVSLDEGSRHIRELCQQYRSKTSEWNEAETRFHFIDTFLTKCLGWPRDRITLEKHLGGEYADYVLGKPVRLIVEAKREGHYFELPAGSRGSPIMSLPSLIASSKSCRAAVEQVQRYCSATGAEFAAV